MLRHNEKGAAIVEFAIILPLLLLLIFGAIEFSLLMYNKQVITNASREGARAGIVAQNPRVSGGDIVNVVTSYCATYLVSFGGVGLGVTTNPVSPQTGTISFGQPLTVTVTYDYQFLVFQNIANTFFGSLFDNITLSAETVMRYE